MRLFGADAIIQVDRRRDAGRAASRSGLSAGGVQDAIHEHHGEGQVTESMEGLKHNVAVRCVKALNVLLITIPFILCWRLYYASRIAYPFFGRGNWLVVALFVFVYIVFARVYDAFLLSLSRISEMMYSQGLAIFISDAILFIVIWLLSRRFPNMLPGLAAMAVQILLSCAWCLLAHRWYFSTYPPKKTMIVYDFRQELELLIREYGIEIKFEILQTLSARECIRDLSVLDGLRPCFSAAFGATTGTSS